MKATSETRNPDGWYEINTTLGKVYCGKRKIVCRFNPLFVPAVKDSLKVNKSSKILTNVEDFWNLEAILIKDSPIERDDNRTLEQFY